MAQTIYRIPEKWEERRRKHGENKICEIQSGENITFHFFKS
jgi:hypothetical protein